MTHRVRVSTWLLGTLLVASTPARGQGQGTPEADRVVYRCLDRRLFEQRFVERINPDSVVDPEDGTSSFVWNPAAGPAIARGPWGERPLALSPDQAASTKLGRPSFLSSALVLPALPYFPFVAGQPAVDQRRFALVRGGELSVLATKIPVAPDVRIGDARLVRVVHGDAETLAGVYVVATRTFEGDKLKLRVYTHEASGRSREVFEGPAPSFPLNQVAYFDRATRKLVLAHGKAWDVATGAFAGKITGTYTPWYIEATGHFYDIDYGRDKRAWGLVDAQSGAVIAGGKDGRELVVSRLEVDDKLVARKVEVARALVPFEGWSDGMRTADRWSAYQTRIYKDGPSDALLGVTPGLDVESHDPRWGDGRAAWSFAPSPSGVVVLSGKAVLEERGDAVLLSILVDPRRPKEPIPLSCGVAGRNVTPPPAAMLAGFPLTPDGTRLGLRNVGAVSGQIGRLALVLDRATGAIEPLPKR